MTTPVGNRWNHTAQSQPEPCFSDDSPMTVSPPTRLVQLRSAARGMLDELSDAAMRQQPHPLLSPMLWHVGHVFFVENYWLAERVFEDTRITDPWRTLYFPEECAKGARGAALPDSPELIDWTLQVAAHNDAYWEKADSYAHPLLAGGYLNAFLRQHYAQHLETMRLGVAQLALETPAPAQTLRPVAPSRQAISVAACDVTLGCAAIEAYDNEQPPVIVPVADFEIADTPVSNAEWAGFMAADGYHRAEFWDDAGWAWREQMDIEHPQHWQPQGDGQWAIHGLHRAPAMADEPVHGIGWYEARAFARYAHARLPSEREWEAARRADRLRGIGQVWEWCDEAFAPYPGFRAFPYEGYSMPWFDGAHFVVRGASVHTEPDVRRPSFRNFYPPTHRHIFAGFRLAW